MMIHNDGSLENEDYAAVETEEGQTANNTLTQQ